MKKLLFLLSIITVLLFSLSFVQKSIAEEPTPYKTICHHTPANLVTHNFMNEQSYLGHLGTPHSSETFDTDGACATSTYHLACISEACVTVEGEGLNSCETNEDCGGVTIRHFACVNETCVNVEGEGLNSCDLKNENSDCQEVTPSLSPTPNSNANSI